MFVDDIGFVFMKENAQNYQGGYPPMPPAQGGYPPQPGYMPQQAPFPAAQPSYPSSQQPQRRLDPDHMPSPVSLHQYLLLQN